MSYILEVPQGNLQRVIDNKAPVGNDVVTPSDTVTIALDSPFPLV